MKTDDIVEYARECVGTPFQHQGRICGLALDCVGVVVHVAEHFGLEPVDAPVGYGRNPNNGSLEAVCDAQPWLYRVRDRQAGDVLLMRFKGEPMHVGIYTGANIIHGYAAAGKVVDHRLDDRWASRIARVYRFVGAS